MEAFQVHRDGWCFTRKWVNVSYNTGAAAVWNQLDACLVAILEKRAHVVFVGGIGNTLRKGFDLSRAKRNPVGQALSAGMKNPLGRVGSDQWMGW